MSLHPSKARHGGVIHDSDPVTKPLNGPGNQLQLPPDPPTHTPSCPDPLEGVCGDPFQHTSSIHYVNPGSIQATYTAGSVINVQWWIQVNHGGRIGVKLCPRRDNINQACFDQYPLARADVPTERFVYIMSSMGTLGTMSANFRLPSGVSCSGGCVLQWEYLTMNSCFEPCNRAVCGVYADRVNPVTGQRNMGTCCLGCSAANVPEIFRNCADIVITGGGPTPTPSPSPTGCRSTAAPGGACGPANDACCPSGQCCSQWGWCGVTSGHCSTGCQRSYGSCWAAARAARAAARAAAANATSAEVVAAASIAQQDPAIDPAAAVAAASAAVPGAPNNSNTATTDSTTSPEPPAVQATAALATEATPSAGEEQVVAVPSATLPAAEEPAPTATAAATNATTEESTTAEPPATTTTADAAGAPGNRKLRL